MARYRSSNRFEFNTANTIDDVTGLKVKLSETMNRWDGVVTTPENFEPRQPQDYPVTPRPSRSYIESRGDQSEPTVTPFDPDNESNYGL